MNLVSTKETISKRNYDYLLKSLRYSAGHSLRPTQPQWHCRCAHHLTWVPLSTFAALAFFPALALLRELAVATPRLFPSGLGGKTFHQLVNVLHIEVAHLVATVKEGAWSTSQ